MNKEEYELLLIAEKVDEKLKSEIEKYEADNDIASDNKRFNYFADSESVNTDNITNNIDDIHEQDTEKLKQSLDKKEKIADYQKTQKEKREREFPTEKKPKSSGLLKLLIAVLIFSGGFMFFFRNQGFNGTKTTLQSENNEVTENRTEEQQQRTEQNTETMAELF